MNNPLEIMITLNPLELLATVTNLLVWRLILEKANFPEICTDLIDLILNPILGEVFNQSITLLLIYIFINPQKRFD
ncbi:hypothetical protein B0A78_11175 [Flavobacterium columnare NBRC 100251 = ATCC 23463]|uniref:hypothetical protein n=1 Tax=Flavobacterium columnare TaxID=996 RepID=UPI0007FB1CF3|nr:hypothetical protein [Flavobacterium columnare]APT21489.1 hypothetical protein BU993_01840 [Flavobacterium columnare]PDS22810.1 hypothetical protein B0A78_11175 [Flavobacterium columnare NBRC 100251 = ATCC 23463]QOH23434.1 hypothetical protein GSQ57_01865 [Flavobacterium columnare]GEM58916.1 hypothetical protein FC1_21540 [Flavobacterium columnare NBRC 100251 = ATCC 23463]